MKPDFIIPYRPRYPQREIHARLDESRFSVIVAHRRMGKTVCALNHIIKAAWSIRRNDGRFAYLSPYRNQAKAIAWDYLRAFAGAVPDARFSEADLECRLPNGSRIRLYGADNPDALRGIYLDGAILDEVADMKPNVWGEIIRPALSDRNGWAVFIGTPKGQNLFYDLYSGAPEAGWYSALYRADETGVISAGELELARAAMSEAQFRQEFLCDFSAACDNVLITIDLVSRAATRALTEADVRGAPRIIGVDVARFGDDRSAICEREGLFCHPMRVYSHLDNMTFAGIIASEISRWSPDAVFVDSGRGEGVIDRLRQLGFTVHEVNFGGAAIKSGQYANKRSEMWDAIREWLEQGGAIPNDSALKSDLSAPTYSFNAAGKMVLEAKEHIKERGLRSPDFADALALTFAMPVAPKRARGAVRNCADYNPYAVRAENSAPMGRGNIRNCDDYDPYGRDDAWAWK
jgi:hypothetical protein